MNPEDPFALMARHLTKPDGADPRSVSCFVALGDSFTAGTGCAPGESWADRIAASLRRRDPRLTYRNLAEDGATSETVLAQAGSALQLEPDLVTVICGANDVLRSVRPDVGSYAHTLELILDRLREGVPGVAILTATSPESWRFMELGPRTRARVSEGIRRINESTRAISARRGVPCFDVVGHPGLGDAANFGPDGLHPSPAGHERATRELAHVLRDELGIDLDSDRRQAR
jgi:phosphatidylinositol alpha 1,6-mannosyltransferase